MMLDTVRARFPDLVGYIIFFGAPLGIVFGTVNRRQTPGRPGEAKFSLSQAGVVGGLAGIWRMGVWSVDGEGKSLSLIAGLIQLLAPVMPGWHYILSSRASIGASFGLLFQRDVLGYGSCLGWDWVTAFSGGS